MNNVELCTTISMWTAYACIGSVGICMTTWACSSLIKEIVKTWVAWDEEAEKNEQEYDSYTY